MGAPYAYPNETLNFVEIVQYLNNDVLNNYLGMAILGLVFFIMLTATISKTNDPLLSTAISGMLCFVLSVLMVYLNIAGEVLAWLMLLTTMVSIAIMYYRGR